MEVEKEVTRQVTRSKNPKRTLAQAGGLKVRRSTRVRVANKNTNGTAKGGPVGRRNAKARSERMTANSNQQNKIKAPTKRAVNAALRAINNSGFKTPKGMKMVISFTPDGNTKENKAGGGNKNKNPKKTGGKNSKTQRGNNRR